MGWRHDNETVYAGCVGSVVKGVHADRGDVNLFMEDGRTLTLHLDGNCCSDSYYTDTSQFDELIGAKIIGIEERDGASETPAEKPQQDDNDRKFSWHFLVFITSNGHVTIDWRNDSNGYYDGSVDPSLA